MKLFVDEPGTKAVIDLVNRTPSADIYVSALAFVEVRSALRQRAARNDISKAHISQAILSLEEESRRIVQQGVLPTVLSVAIELVDRHPLRSLDSLQLASAIVAGKQRGTPPTFVCSDHRLIKAARSEHLDGWDPVLSDKPSFTVSDTR